MVDLGKTIQVIGSNGYTRKLSLDDCVIMYDNNSKIPIFLLFINTQHVWHYVKELLI